MPPRVNLITLGGFDPLLPLHIGPVNEREALESGRQLKA